VGRGPVDRAALCATSTREATAPEEVHDFVLLRKRSTGFVRAVGRELVALRGLPRPVRRFYVRALLRALVTKDWLSRKAHARPRELRALLAAADGAGLVVEIGTGTAWTAIALALADQRRRVVTYDPHVFPQRAHYLAMVSQDVQARIELREGPGEDGPRVPIEVGLVFIDSGWHEREPTAAAFRAWEPSVVPGGVVAFHDYGDFWPGVREAVAELGLEGYTVGVLFVWRKPSRAAQPPDLTP
jgi:predicted O-methyltransferase YrrM